MKQAITTTGFVQIVAFVLISGVICLSQAQVPSFGKCPSNVQTVQNLDLNAYLGRWYEYSKYPFIFELHAKCIYAEYGLQPDGNVSVYNADIGIITNTEKSINGTAAIVAPGKLSVKFQNVPSFVGGSNYWVLGTDYSNYAVVYSCTDIFGIVHAEVVWILTRERKPSPDIIKTATDIIRANAIDLTPLQKTNQENCPENQ